MSSRRKKRNDEETSYWSSYSDMMAALLLVFVLIIAFTMMQSKKQYEDKEKELIEQQRLVNEQQSEMEEQENELSAQQEKLETQQNRLKEQESELNSQKGQLDLLVSDNQSKESELTAQQSKLDALVAENQSKESELQEQQSVVQSQQKTMQEQQEKLDKLIGVRSEIVEALKKEFDDTELGVRVDPQTGAIAFDSSIMFDFNDAELKPEGTDFLKEFVPRYLSILLQDNFRDYISEIIIEGHTDTVGSYLFNLELSQKRALSVAKFCLQENNTDFGTNIDIDELRKLVTANGRSFSDPVYSANKSVDMDASRRVEFKFRLKDEDMITEMSDILAGDTEQRTEG